MNLTAPRVGDCRAMPPQLLPVPQRGGMGASAFYPVLVEQTPACGQYVLPLVKPKHFHTFVSGRYYPEGGMRDYLGSAETLDDAKALADAAGRESGRTEATIAQLRTDGSLRMICYRCEATEWIEASLQAATENGILSD